MGMIKSLAGLVLGASLFLNSGCVNYKFQGKNLKRESLPSALVQEYSYSKTNKLEYKVEDLSQERNYDIKRVTLLVPPEEYQLGNRRIIFDYYDIKGTNKTPAILVLPILGGRDYPLEKHLAVSCVKNGYAAVIVHREKLKKELAQVDIVNDMLKQTVTDHMRVIDWMETQNDLDIGNIGAFGASMGAIKGAMLMPLEKRIKAGVFGLVGGDLPHILLNTTERGIVKIRDAYLLEKNITKEELENKLRKDITCDPNLLAKYIDPARVMLVLASSDDVVPYKKGLELKEKMGNPKTLVYPAGHYTILPFVLSIESQANRFFEKQFKGKNGENKAFRNGNGKFTRR